MYLLLLVEPRTTDPTEGYILSGSGREKADALELLLRREVRRKRSESRHLK